MPNEWKYLLCFTLIYRKLKVDLQMLKFNDAYILKQNPTDTKRVYLLAKKDWGINVILLKMRRIEKNTSFMKLVGGKHLLVMRD